MTVSDGALSVAVAALQQIAQLGSQERDRVTAQAALDCIDALGERVSQFPRPTMQEIGKPPPAVREQEA